MCPTLKRLPSYNLCALVFILFTACVFEPDGEYFKEVKQLDAFASIDLNTINSSDTIILEKPTDFQFKVDISGVSDVVMVEIVVDSKVMVTSYHKAGQFHLSQDFLSLGFHTLTVRFNAKSNSGSLADKLDGEYFQVWRTWVVHVNRYDTSRPPDWDLRVVEKDGMLRVEWDPYTQKSFVSYKLKISSTGKELVFTDSLKTFWFDSTFLFGSAEYLLTVTNLFGSTSTVARIEENQKLRVDYNPVDSTVMMHWKPARFYHSFKNILITENNTLRETITRASDSTYKFKLNEILWGRTESVMMQLFAKDVEERLFEDRVHLPAAPVKRLNNRPTLYYQNGRVIGHAPGYALFYYFDGQMNATDSVTVYSGPLSVPYSGNFIYYVYGGNIVRWDIATGAKTYHMDAPDFVIQPELCGASNGTVSFTSFNHRDLWDVRSSVSIQNTNDNSFLYKSNDSYDPKISLPVRSKILSDDGRFAYTWYNQSVMKLAGMQDLGSLPQIGWFFSFRPDNSDEILLNSTEQFTIIGAEDLSVRRSYTIPLGYSVSSYDPVTHYIVCEKTDATIIHLINIDTGDHRTYPVYSTGWKLMNGFLYNWVGQYKKII